MITVASFLCLETRRNSEEGGNPLRKGQGLSQQCYQRISVLYMKCMQGRNEELKEYCPTKDKALSSLPFSFLP